MTPELVQTLRRLALNDEEVTKRVMSGEQVGSLEPRVVALLRLAVLISVDTDAGTFRWVVDQAVADGVEDHDMVDTLVVVAPLIGIARLTSALPGLMQALEVEETMD